LTGIPSGTSDRAIGAASWLILHANIILTTKARITDRIVIGATSFWYTDIIDAIITIGAAWIIVGATLHWILHAHIILTGKTIAAGWIAVLAALF